ALTALEGLPEVGLLLDVYHMNIEETDVPAAIRRADARIAHVQVCANDRGAPGADHLPWREMMAALDEVAYTGPVCIESFTAQNATIATAASIWRPLAESQDTVGVDGLSHLRKVMPRKGQVGGPQLRPLSDRQQRCCRPRPIPTEESQMFRAVARRVKAGTIALCASALGVSL